MRFPLATPIALLALACDGPGRDARPRPSPGDPAPHPTEACNGIDDDGDGEIDEGLRSTWYADADGDGLGDPASAVAACYAPVGAVTEGGDCDDTDPLLTGPLDTERRFVDVSAEAGLDEIGPSWSGEDPCIHEPLAGGAAVGDADGDGDLDVFLPRLYLPDQLLLNDGTGRFALDPRFEGSTDASNGALWVDIDGDRDLDLVVTQLGRHPTLLYVNDGTGALTDEAADRGAALTFFDGCADQTGPSAADIDGDGDLDLLLPAWQERLALGSHPHARLLRNDGTGHFADATEETGLDLLWTRAVFGGLFADRDGDGDPDLHLVADWGGSSLLLNDGAGHFTETLDRGTFTDDNGMGSDLGDVDGDGDLDWFVSAIWQDTTDWGCPPGWGCTGNRLYVDDGTGHFTDGTDAAGVRGSEHDLWAWGAAFLDYDLDGALDLAVTGGMPIASFWQATGRLWRNTGGGRFEDRTCRSGLVDRREGRGLVPFDADADGDPDLLVTASAAPPALWRNEGPEDAGWLSVSLDQPGPNRFAIGAVVTVRATPDGPEQIRPIHANPSHVSSRPPLAAFGLGDHRGPVHEITVLWPDGTRTVRHDLGPGSVLVQR